MLNETERQALIDRVAANVREFDDDTLLELDRLTDPATYAEGRRPAAPASGLTRRQLLAGVIAGGATVTVAAAGTALALRPERGSRGEADRLRALADGYGELEATGLDGQVRAGIAAVEPDLAAMTAAGAELAGGVSLVEGTLSVAVPGVDAGFLAMLRQNVLDPARAAVAAGETLGQTWRDRLAVPVGEVLARRDDVRREVARLREAVPAAGR